MGIPYPASCSNFVGYRMNQVWFVLQLSVLNTYTFAIVTDSDGVKDMTHEAKAKDLTCHAALKPQTLYTVQQAQNQLYV